MPTNLIRMSGWVLMIGAFLFYLFFPFYYLDTNNYYNVDRSLPWWGISYDLSFYVSPFLLAIGMLGLRRRYGEAGGRLGKNILLLSPLGIAVTLFGLTRVSIYEQAWYAPIAGPFVLFACLTVFGVLVMNKKALPFLAGVWFPALIIITAVYAGISGEMQPDVSALLLLMVTIQFLALLMLGYKLQAGVPQELMAARFDQPANQP